MSVLFFTGVFVFMSRNASMEMHLRRGYLRFILFLICILQICKCLCLVWHTRGNAFKMRLFTIYVMSNLYFSNSFLSIFTDLYTYIHPYIYVYIYIRKHIHKQELDHMLQHICCCKYGSVLASFHAFVPLQSVLSAPYATHSIADVYR